MATKENTEREIIRAAQAASFGADSDDALLAAAASVYLRDYAPLENDAVASNGRSAWSCFVPAVAP